MAALLTINDESVPTLVKGIPNIIELSIIIIPSILD